MIKQAFILCAGKGTRMHPDTLDKPKCLLDIAGKPVLGRIADWLNRHGISDVIINLNWKSELVLDYLDTLPDLSPICSLEERLLGTAGGIAAVQGCLHETFVVVYGDVLTNMNLFRLAGFHTSHRADVTIASYRVDNPHECGVIIPPEAGPVDQLVEKPAEFISDVVNAGVLICRKEVFAGVREGWDIARDLIPSLLADELWWRKRVYHLPLLSNEWLIDMGTRANYLRCCDKYSTKEVRDDHDQDTTEGELPGRRE